MDVRRAKGRRGDGIGFQRFEDGVGGARRAAGNIGRKQRGDMEMEEE